MIRFQTLWLPLLLALVSAISLPFVRRILARARLPLCLGPDGGEAFSAVSKRPLYTRLPLFLECVATGFLLFASASPVRLERRTVQLDRGSDVLFVLDLSPSMSARDMGGESRFERSRALVRSFAASHPASALGLAVLGSTAALRVPPTTDHRAFLAALDRLAIGELGDGTALGLGIMTAVLHLSASSAPGRLIVLITDGENNAGSVHPLTAAALAREAGLVVQVVGLGAEGQALIDYVDPLSKERRRGSFLSRYDESALEAIAREGGGAWLRAPGPSDLDEAFARISRGTLPGGRTRDEFASRPLYRESLGTGLALLALALLLRRVLMGATV